jgi:hypothetical protein
LDDERRGRLDVEEELDEERRRRLNVEEKLEEVKVSAALVPPVYSIAIYYL